MLQGMQLSLLPGKAGVRAAADTCYNCTINMPCQHFKRALDAVHFI